MRALRLICGVIVATIAGFDNMPPGMAAGAPLEHEIEATFLYKFVPFVTWPDTAFGAPTAPLMICIVGQPGLANSLRQMVAGQRNGGHPIAIRAVNAADAHCQILYIPGTDGPADAQAIAAVKGRPVLIVTDLPADAAGHGMIGFVVAGDHVRFDIDNAAAADCGLVISSKLLGRRAWSSREARHE